VRDLQQGARLVRKRLAKSRVALLFGSEKRGLTNEDLSHCHWLLRIPTTEVHRSMNLGQAVAVCLYELARAAKTNAPPEKLRLAPTGDLERLTSLLLDVLNASGYLKNPTPSNTRPRSAAPAEEKIRRFVRRMNLSSADAELLLGMLRQILWKLDQTGKASRIE
jgi:tRNA/rRNA methyltransferase